MDKSIHGSALQADLKQRFLMTIVAAGEGETSLPLSDYPVAVSQLGKIDSCNGFMQHYAHECGTADSAIAGTLFAKRYSVLCMGLLYTMSVYDIGVPIGLCQVRLRVVPDSGGAIAYKLVLPEESGGKADRTPLAMEPNNGSERRKVAVAAFSRQLQAHVDVVFGWISACTGANQQVMWSLVQHNVQTMYAGMTCEAEQGASSPAATIAADRQVLLQSKPGNNLAGKLRFQARPGMAGGGLYVRRFCCLAYSTSPGGQDHGCGKQHGYCQTCPKLSVNQRPRQNK